MKGIEREVRRHLPWTARKYVAAESGAITLRMPVTEKDAFVDVSARISKALSNVGGLQILPSEVEDILGISSRERHKWVKDNRLRSAGTKTVKLRGRAKAVTFHVFDPRHIEDVLDGDLTQTWRDDDAQTAAENRRRAAGKAALARAARNATQTGRYSVAPNETERTQLKGWDDFAADGLLR